LDLSGVTLWPIGNSILPFTGNFDGQGFVIRNAAMNLPNKDFVGLFGYVGEHGVISDLGIEDVNILAKRFVGGLAAYNKGTISNCNSSGRVAGESSSYIGGLIGLSWRDHF
jgi:hypothetical protein